MDLKLQSNRALIALSAISHATLHKSTMSNSKNVLIVFQQIFGDAIVISESLRHYADLYSHSEGYEITFIARSSVIAFMEETVGFDSRIKVESVDFKRLVDDYNYYKKVVSKYRDYASVLIVPGTSLSAEIFSCACNADRKIGLVRSIPVTRPFINKFFYNHAYTETVIPDRGDMMLQRHRLLLNYLGLRNYKAKLPNLLPKDKIINESRYVVCCPGSSKIEKCWPTDRFATVIDHIIEKYDIKVHLCGGADEAEFETRIKLISKYPDKIESHIGKTSFSDWSAIVQHANLVIGNDSATMHLAAASRRKAICISGVYDKYQFFPYKVDELDEGDRLPVTMIKDMPCEWCRTKGYDAGYGNEDCRKQIGMGGTAICVMQIAVETVIKEVDKLLQEF